jgi:hypothetical protein
LYEWEPLCLASVVYSLKQTPGAQSDPFLSRSSKRAAAADGSAAGGGFQILYGTTGFPIFRSLSLSLSLSWASSQSVISNGNSFGHTLLIYRRRRRQRISRRPYGAASAQRVFFLIFPFPPSLPPTILACRRPPSFLSIQLISVLLSLFPSFFLSFFPVSAAAPCFFAALVDRISLLLLLPSRFCLRFVLWVHCSDWLCQMPPAPWMDRIEPPSSSCIRAAWP